MNKPENTIKSRREFLRTGVATGAGVAAVSLAPAAVAASESPIEEVKKDVGYHETPHIRDYYRTAEF